MSTNNLPIQSFKNRSSELIFNILLAKIQRLENRVKILEARQKCTEPLQENNLQKKLNMLEMKYQELANNSSNSTVYLDGFDDTLFESITNFEIDNPLNNAIENITKTTTNENPTTITKQNNQ
jgi:hypothetical protein